MGNISIPDAAQTGRTASYQALLDQMNGGLFLAEVGADVRITYASPAVVKMISQDGPAFDFHSQNALERIYPEDLQSLLSAIHRTQTSGESSNLIYRAGADGTASRHLHLVRCSLHEDGTASVIGILTDMTAYQKAERQFRLSEERYRIANTLSRSLMIWEVDIPTHTLYQSEETSRALGHGGSVYHNVPESLLATGTIHPTSVGDFRRMYANLYAGDDAGEYRILTKNATGTFTWVRAAFQIIRDEDGSPLRSIGIVEKMPDAGKEMQLFEDEAQFAQEIESQSLGTLQINLTQDTIEKSANMPTFQTSSYSRLIEQWKRRVHPDDVSTFLEATNRENLIQFYEDENRWHFANYREIDASGMGHWVSLVINLLRHPISGNIYAFIYVRDADLRHRWETAMKTVPQRDAMTLYTMESFREIAEIAAVQMSDQSKCSMTVFEIPELRRIKKSFGELAAQQVLQTVSRLCRTMLGGGAVIGHPVETQFAVFRVDAVSTDTLRRGIIRNRTQVHRFIEDLLGASYDIACGFAMCDRQEFQFDELLKRATMACKIAQEQPNNMVTEYSAPEEKLVPEQRSAPACDVVRKRVLVTDDDAISRSVTAINLAQEYEVDEAEDGAVALELLRKNTYALLRCDIQMPNKTGWDVLDAMQREKMLLKTPVIMITADGGQDSEVMALDRGASDVIVKPIVPQVLLSRARNIIGRQEAAAAMERNNLYELQIQQQAAQLRRAEYDELTGLYNKNGFGIHVRERLDADPTGRYRILRWDLDSFKMVNDTMGVETGDRLLREIGAAMQTADFPDCTLARWEADHFVLFMPDDAMEPSAVMEQIERWLKNYPFNFTLAAHMGVYPVEDHSVEVSIMCDRALLALRSAKHSYAERVTWYDESFRNALLEEQELSGEMVSALDQKQFVLYFQPQINYESGGLLGAEALVRWQHPVKGLIPPGKFIPLFERNGFISALDEFVWEESCRYMRKWQDQWPERNPLSVSVNISRVDIYNPRLCSLLKEMVERYQLSASLLRLEITESAYMNNPEQLISVVRELRDAGFTVEMDDFGAGFSSLNTLKDVPVNVLKLDTQFLSDCESNVRGGNILSSIIRMAHWLNIPVIAEGVETKTQADYLKSLNCLYMQGYYFSRPVPAEEFEAKIGHFLPSNMVHGADGDLSGISAFWSSSAPMTLLFNSLFDGAAILEYRADNVEVLRANDRFFSQLGVSRQEYQRYQKRLQKRFEEDQRKIYFHMLDEAIQNGEASCEVASKPLHPGDPPIRTYNRVRLLAENAGAYLFFLATDNIAQKETNHHV